MNIVRGFALGLLCIIAFAAHAYPLDVLEPQENSVFYPDSIVKVVVKPSIDEKFVSVGIGFDELPFDNNLGVYVREFPVPKNALPGKVEFKVEALKESHDLVAISRKINIALSPTVVLVSMSIEPSPIYITMLHASDTDAIDWATERLRISGGYSDGVEREISSSELGTTYTSSDNNIVTVDSEGTVVAQKVGRAKITVRNAGKEASVDVIIVVKR